MTDAEKRAAHLGCAKFLNGHAPARMNETLSNLASLVAAGETSDFYGAGDLIEKFELEVATLLGKPAAVFMPSGTMAQLIALRIWSDRKANRRVAFHATSHLELHERHAYRELHGLEAELLGEGSKPLTAADLEASSGPYAVALIELPQRELGGVLPTWTDLQAMSLFLRRRGSAAHLDGARLWETQPFYQKTYAEICELFDSVYVSFYKGLGGLAGAMLCGPPDFIAEARVWQRRHGGNLVRLYPYILSARDGLKQRLPKMGRYHEKAKDIAHAIRDLEGLRVQPTAPHANMMHLFFDRPADALEDAFALIATQKKISLFSRVHPVEGGPSSKAELSVGDGALDLETSQIRDLFAEALSLSARTS